MHARLHLHLIRINDLKKLNRVTSMDSLGNTEKVLTIFALGGRIGTAGMDGSTRIFIECATRWAQHGHHICLLGSEHDYEICHKYGLNAIDFIVVPYPKIFRSSVLFSYLFLTIKLSIAALRLRLKGKSIVIYSGSDFWPTSIPGFILKIMSGESAKWVVCFFLLARKPFSKEFPYKGKGVFVGLLYYLSQLPVYSLAKKFSDMVWVTDELDRLKFIDGKRLTSEKVVTIRWGVDTKTPLLVPECKKIFDAVFVGRLHPQKGVLQLIDLWKHVCEKKKDAKLIIIGDGQLKSEVSEKIERCGLRNNVMMLGFKDGLEKIRLLKETKIFVHPAIYDTGAIAPAESMACGLPGVCFDLPALRTYYPKGMIKVQPYDFTKFAQSIIELLTNRQLYNELKEEALQLSKEFDWDKKAQELLELFN